MKIDKKHFYVFVALVLFSVKSVLNMSSIIVLPSFFDLFINFAVIVLCIPNIISKKFKTKEIVTLLFFSFFILLIVFITKEFMIMASFILIIAMRGMNIISIIKVINKTKIIVVLLHVIPFLIMYYIGASGLVNRYSLDGNARYSFFFQNQNSFAATVFWIICELIFLHLLQNKSIKKHHDLLFYSMLIVISYFTFVMTISRTFLVNILILFILLFLFFKKNGKKVMFFSMMALPVLLVFSYILCSLYSSNSELLIELDQILSRRISLSNFALNKYGVSFLPNHVDYSTTVFIKNRYIMNMVIDNIYIRFVISYGLCSFIALCSCFINKIYVFYKKCYPSVFYVFIIVYAIFGFTENVLLNCCLCFPLIFLSDFIFIRKGE